MTETGSPSNSPGSSSDSKSPIEQLVELLVYAPVGLVYEYPDVLPQLIKRGKSQVQLAKVLGQMASQQGKAGGEAKTQEEAPGLDDALNEALGQVASILAKGITEFGQIVGLAPTTPSPSAEAPLNPSREPRRAPESNSKASKVPRVPIAGYDSLKAREIVPMLDDLTPAQRVRVRRYEEATRGRKTVLGKLDKLDR